MIKGLKETNKSQESQCIREPQQQSGSAECIQAIPSLWDGTDSWTNRAVSGRVNRMQWRRNNVDVQLVLPELFSRILLTDNVIG